MAPKARSGRAAEERVFNAVLDAILDHRLAPGTKLGERELAELRAFVAEEQKAYDRGDRKTGQRLSIRFHKLLSEMAGNAELDRFMEHLICRTPLLTLAHKGPRLAYCGSGEHREIVEALAKRDPAAAVKRIQAHLTNLESQLHLEAEP